jgi:hypothetical protein
MSNALVLPPAGGEGDENEIFFDHGMKRQEAARNGKWRHNTLAGNKLHLHYWTM